MTHSFFRRAVVLGLLSAIGPFAVDMYLPALPAIGVALHADVHGVQLSLTAFFISFALSQIVYGPASDQFGRKAPLYVGIGLFVIGSVGCALAPDIGSLIAFRFMQGLGGGAPIVIPRAVVRDLHTGVEATRLMSTLMLVFSVSPILAPLVGSFVIDAAGWRAIFWLVALIGVAGLLLLAVALEETRPPEQRTASDSASALRAFALLLRDRRFIGLTGIGAFGMAGFFVYLANSSFVMINHYGLTPRQFGFAFAVNAASFFGVSQFAAAATARFGTRAVVVYSVWASVVALGGLWLLYAAGVDRLGLLIGFILVSSGFQGLTLPTTSVMALDDHGEIAGAASALMGTLQLVIGALVMGLAGALTDGSARAMVASMVISTLCAAALMRWTLVLLC